MALTHHTWTQVLEVSHKTGKYDGAKRIRLLFRRMPEEQAQNLRPIELSVSLDIDAPCTVKVHDRFTTKEVLWSQSFIRYSHRITNPVHAGDILTWHWNRYYRFLQWCDVKDLAYEFGQSVIGLTLNEANRLASRQLYLRAKDQGWRKLTLREQSRWQLRGQWHRDEDVVAAKVKLAGAPNGASEATNRACIPNGRLDAYEDLAQQFDPA